jgi:hypothetical protein
MKNIRYILIIILLLNTAKLFAQAGIEKPLTIENYYKLKWGHADEFIALWKKNHYPLLKKLLEKGDLLSIKAETPILHSGEDTRWDFKVTMTFKTEHLALDYSIVDPYKKQLSPTRKAISKQNSNALNLSSPTGIYRWKTSH